MNVLKLEPQSILRSSYRYYILLFLIFPLSLQAQIQLGQTITGGSNIVQLGRAVDIDSDGDRMVFSHLRTAFNPLIGQTSITGKVGIYEFTGTWTLLGNEISGVGNGDGFGKALSMNADGTIVAVGIPQSDANGIDAGSVRVFQYNGMVWVQIGSDINGVAAGDEFGSSLDINSDGTKLVVGAPKHDGVPSGKVTVEIYDILGKKIMTSSFEGNGVNEVFLSNIKTGIYIVSLESDLGKRMNKKLS